MESPAISASRPSALRTETLLKAFSLMATAREMTFIYEANAPFTSKYVHATSRGHEAVQLAVSMQLLAKDFLSAYYRDDSMLLGIGLTPYDLMLQLMAKREDPFSGGRTYYSHPSLNRPRHAKDPAPKQCNRYAGHSFNRRGYGIEIPPRSGTEHGCER